MEWSHLSVLITGSGGFIGSHLLERMVALGARSRGLVRYNSSGSWGWLDQSPVKGDFEIVQGDICDPACLATALRGIDIVFHLAALIGIPYSYSAPLSYVRTNVEGTLNVLEAARRANVACVVHTSTSEVYGTAKYVPIDEEHPLQGQSPYSASKIGADKMAEAYHHSFGLPVAILRPFNTFGPRQSARAVIPTIVTQALTASEVRLGNLAPTRDLNFVADTVEGFVKTAQSPEAIGEVINIGSGREISIGELALTVANLVGIEPRLSEDASRIRPKGSEVERLLADSTKAERLIGWTSQHSLEKGLELTIEWLQRHIDDYRPETYSV